MTLQEEQIFNLDGMLSTNLPDYARHWIGMPGPIKRHARIVDVDTFERRGEPVRVTLAPDLAVRNDVKASVLLRLDGHYGRVILRFGEKRLWDAP
jgi:hypothetical protein